MTAFSGDFGKSNPAVVCLSEAWTSSMNELRMLFLDNYLPPMFHPRCNTNDSVVVYVQGSNHFEVACTKASLFIKTLCNQIRTNNNLLWLACLSLSRGVEY